MPRGDQQIRPKKTEADRRARLLRGESLHGSNIRESAPDLNLTPLISTGPSRSFTLSRHRADGKRKDLGEWRDRGIASGSEHRELCLAVRDWSCKVLVVDEDDRQTEFEELEGWCLCLDAGSRRAIPHPDGTGLVDGHELSAIGRKVHPGDRGRVTVHRLRCSIQRQDRRHRHSSRPSVPKADIAVIAGRGSSGGNPFSVGRNCHRIQFPLVSATDFPPHRADVRWSELVGLQFQQVPGMDRLVESRDIQESGVRRKLDRRNDADRPLIQQQRTRSPFALRDRLRQGRELHRGLKQTDNQQQVQTSRHCRLPH